ncbi:MAG: hypothetical protein ACFB15_29795 [Cyclobacteriaceae bacterium]
MSVQKIAAFDINGRSNFRTVEIYSDDPEAMLDLTDKAFLVEDGNIVPYR